MMLIYIFWAADGGVCGGAQWQGGGGESPLVMLTFACALHKYWRHEVEARPIDCQLDLWSCLFWKSNISGLFLENSINSSLVAIRFMTSFHWKARCCVQQARLLGVFPCQQITFPQQQVVFGSPEYVFGVRFFINIASPVALKFVTSFHRKARMRIQQARLLGVCPCQQQPACSKLY